MATACRAGFSESLLGAVGVALEWRGRRPHLGDDKSFLDRGTASRGWTSKRRWWCGCRRHHGDRQEF